MKGVPPTLLPLLTLVLISSVPLTPTKSSAQAGQETPPAADTIKLLPTIRPACPVRLGGVYTLGLGDKSSPFEDSAALGVKLSKQNAKWINANCDVIALNADNITPETFRAMIAAQPDSLPITPLLYVYASTLYEQPDHHGGVGGWGPQMASYTLRDAQGHEVPYPEPGGHWMDFGSTEWAAHWRDQVLALVQKYGAQGVVAAELPINNTFVNAKLEKYTTLADRAKATAAWLAAARDPQHRFLLIPSALGFDMLAGHSTLPPLSGAEEPQLDGRLWDDYYPLIDGAWVEGWLRPYWMDAPLPEKDWELQLEAADRAGYEGQVFIAAAAYSNDTDLEYALASYLLVAHHQGRLVFQPMPLVKGQRKDAGYSLAVLQQEVRAKPGFFNVPLGRAIQSRHPVPTEGGNVWRRAYQFGVVYVNSTDNRKMVIELGAPMRRLSGKMVKRVVLMPHTGAVLLYR